MTLRELRSLVSGDRVRFSEGGGACTIGIVVAAGINSGSGNHYLRIEWMSEPKGSYQRHSYVSADWPWKQNSSLVRRLQRERTEH